MTELSPARQELLKQVVDIQERALSGCILIFRGLRQSQDPEVSSVCEEALKHLINGTAVIEAMIDGLNSTKH